MLRKIQYNFLIAIDAISQNFLRAVLTSLGIVFGVASVIAMLAIGRGTQEKILVQMNTLGANNIIINPIIEQEEGDVEEELEDAEERQPNRFTPGLTMLDAIGIARLPHVKSVSPEIELETVAMRSGRKRSIKIVGVTPAYFQDSEFELLDGTLFSSDHLKYSRPVCVIGYGVKAKFFATEEPIGKKIKCGKHWLTIIGVLGPRNISKEVRDELGIRNYDLDIYLPIQTVLLRYKNRSLVTKTGIIRAAREDNDEDEENTPPKNYHQIDKIVVKVDDTKYSRRLAEVLNRMLSRRHNKVVDFQIIVPETLLKKKQENIDLFNWVLRAIASISLLVGGIGIMNIMLASVMERIKEIGLRLSIGATKKDIILQFMCEAVVISITGGVLGILVGVGISFFIEYLTNIDTIITGAFIGLSFPVAVSIGLIFGIYPAQQAAKQDPVVSLRSN